MTYESRNFGMIGLLDEATQIKVRHLIDRCELLGLDFLIVSGYRSEKEQNSLYAQGRTTPGNIVTYVKGGNSKHNHGVAIDFVPVVYRVAMGHLDAEKKSTYRAVLEWAATREFRKIARIAVDLGFDYPFPDWDKGHLEYNEELSLPDLKKGKKPNAAKAKRAWKADIEHELKIARLALEREAVTPQRKEALQPRVNMLKRKLERI